MRVGFEFFSSLFFTLTSRYRMKKVVYIIYIKCVYIPARDSSTALFVFFFTDTLALVYAQNSFAAATEIFFYFFSGFLHARHERIGILRKKENFYHKPIECGGYVVCMYFFSCFFFFNFFPVFIIAPRRARDTRAFSANNCVRGKGKFWIEQDFWGYIFYIWFKFRGRGKLFLEKIF